MATAGDQIDAAYRMLGVIGEGQTASTAQYANGLTALNQMLDAWSISKLNVYAMQDQSFTWPAGTATRTLGPSGQLVGNRPVMLDPSTYYAIGTQSFPIDIISQADYNTIALKATSATYPDALTVDYTMPDMSITLYPVPSGALTMHFMSVTELTQPATTATVLVVPPGYLRAFKFNLACEVAAEYGSIPSPPVQRIAASSLRAIKRSNVKPEDMLMSLPFVFANGGTQIPKAPR